MGFFFFHLITVSSITVSLQADCPMGRTPTTPDGKSTPNCLNFLWQEEGITAHLKRRKKCTDKVTEFDSHLMDQFLLKSCGYVTAYSLQRLDLAVLYRCKVTISAVISSRWTSLGLFILKRIGPYRSFMFPGLCLSFKGGLNYRFLDRPFLSQAQRWQGWPLPSQGRVDDEELAIFWSTLGPTAAAGERHTFIKTHSHIDSLTLTHHYLYTLQATIGCIGLDSNLM